MYWRVCDEIMQISQSSYGPGKRPKSSAGRSFPVEIAHFPARRDEALQSVSGRDVRREAGPCRGLLGGNAGHARERRDQHAAGPRAVRRCRRRTRRRVGRRALKGGAVRFRTDGGSLFLIAWFAILVASACDESGVSPGDATDATDADAPLDDAGDADVGPTLAPPLTDDEGRAVFYVGVNLGEETKRPPDFLPDLSDDDLAMLERWGVTLVRFLLLWEAIEPARGVWDEAYLGTVDDVSSLRRAA